MAESVTLYAEFTARLGRVAEVEELITAYARDVRAEPGNVVFEVYRRVEAPNAFVVFEEYLHQQAFDAHLAADAGRRFNEALMPLIVEPASRLSFLRKAGPA